MTDNFLTTQDELDIAASRKCFETLLHTKEVTIWPDDLLEVIKKELTATAREIYMELYSLATKTVNKQVELSPIIVSIKELAKHNFRSESTIKFRLAELEGKGFIKIIRKLEEWICLQSSTVKPIILVILRV